MTEIPDLWPAQIGKGASVVTPLAILRTAATQLGERTQQLVTGNVEQELVLGNKFRLEFYLEIPSLDHYRFRLLRVEHDIDSFYPALGHVTRKIGDRKDVDLQSEKEFYDWLKEIFSSQETTKLINTLMQQLRS
jgi:hypothetical protein